MSPSSRTERRLEPQQRRAQVSVDSILEAASLLLEEQGYAALTTNRIAERAGVNVSLVYRYFAGKEAIVGTLIERTAQKTQDALEQVLKENAKAPLRQVAREIIRVLIHTPGIPPNTHRQLVEQIATTERGPRVQATRTSMTSSLARWLTTRNTKQPVSRATLFVLEQALQAATHAAAFYRPKEVPLQEVVEALTELLSHALSPDGDACPTSNS